ncbi:MAG: GntR family transcriptional regulator [Limibacillus sp.]
MNDKDPRFSTIERERVADRVAEELKRLIAGGTLAPGERLPGERQLADMMGVSRVSVRAALQQLKAHGLVTAVQGGGTRVIASAEALDSALTQLIQANTKNLRDLMELRAHLECWAAGRAATRASEKDLDAIRAALYLMTDPDRPVRFKAEDDSAFHMAVAKAAGGGNARLPPLHALRHARRRRALPGASPSDLAGHLGGRPQGRRTGHGRSPADHPGALQRRRGRRRGPTAVSPRNLTLVREW